MGNYVVRPFKVKTIVNLGCLLLRRPYIVLIAVCVIKIANATSKLDFKS